MTAPVRTRPILVTILVVLVVLGGIGLILTGITVLRTYGAGVGGATVTGIVYILLGVVYLAVARGLLKGEAWARTVVLIVSILQVVVLLIRLLTSHRQPDSGAWAGIGSAILDILIIVVLFLPKVREFFGQRRD